MTPSIDTETPARVCDDLQVSPALREAVDVLLASGPAPVSSVRHEQLFRAAVERHQGHVVAPPRWRLALAFALSCALAAGVTTGVLRALRTPPAELVAFAAPQIEATPGAEYRLEAGGVRVTRGQVRVTASDATVVRAGDVEVLLHHARVLADVRDNGAVIFSLEVGEAVVRDTDAAPLGLRAGQRYEAAAPLALPKSAPTARCRGDVACLEVAAAGSGLEAENAQYELGLLAFERRAWADAEGRFEASVRRFPEGVLAPEAQLGLVLSARARGDLGAARRAANDFLTHHPDDVRRPGVEALLRSLK